MYGFELTFTFVGIAIRCSAPRTIEEIWFTLFAITSGGIVFTITIQLALIVGEASRCMTIAFASTANCKIRHCIILCWHWTQRRRYKIIERWFFLLRQHHRIGCMQFIRIQFRLFDHQFFIKHIRWHLQAMEDYFDIGNGYPVLFFAKWKKETSWNTVWKISYFLHRACKREN